MDDVAQDRGEDVFSQTGHQKDNIFHFHNLAPNKEHNANRYIPV